MRTIRRFPALALLVLIFAAGCSSGENQPRPAESAVEERGTPAASDDQEIRSVFERYRNALLAGDGNSAFEHLSPASIGYYVEMKGLALSAPRGALEERSLVDRLHALTLRYVLAPDRLAAMTPLEVIVYAVDAGLIGQGTMLEQQLGELAIDGNTAQATVHSEGHEGEITYTFVRDAGGWKFDLLGILESANETFHELIEENGISETTFIFDTIQAITGQRPTKALWNPAN